MAEQLQVESRVVGGKHENRRLRQAGKVPAVLYGHGRENVCLSVLADQLDTAVRHGGRMIELTGAVSESAFIREVQWNTWGTAVLHVDFNRVSADEKIEVQVAVELRGEAPGLREGGVVDQQMHQVTMECPASSIPEKLELSVNQLALNESLTVADLELPKGASIAESESTVIVSCNPPIEVPEEVEEAAAGEPEVIGAKEKEGEESGQGG